MFNPQLNIEKLQQAYAVNNFISIQNILRDDVANKLNQELLSMEWDLELMDRVHNQKLRVPMSEIKGKQNLAQILDSASGQIARDNMFYMRLVTNMDEFENSSILAEFSNYLNGEEFLQTMRTITGIDQITHAWVEATCYDKHCFLGVHCDSHIPENVVSFVFNLTKVWAIDWGGLLMLSKADDLPPIILPPSWNTLNLFSIPIDHFVSSVCPAANEKRYSLTGWLRTKEVVSG